MRLSVQLYTVRDALSSDLAGTLGQIKKIGLEYVELAGMYGRSATEWKTMLNEEGLLASGAHIGLELLQADLDTVISDAKTIGFEYVILPWVDSSKYAGNWSELGKSLEPIGERLRNEGLTLAYHNHAFEFEGGGLDALYAAASPEFVKAQLDLAWVQIGGENPSEYIRKMSSRVPLVHLKDYDPSQTPQWRPAGQGIVDWEPILAACDEANVQFGSLELDESPGDPIVAVRQSYEFFAEKGLF